MRTLPLIVLLAACGRGSEIPVAPPEPLDPPPLARGVSIERVELVQAAPIALMAEGEPIPGAGPIVQGRPGLLRAHLVATRRASDQPVDVTLTLTHADGSVEERTVEDFSVPDAVDVDALSDTVNFELDETDLEPGMSWAIRVSELEAERVRTGDHERPEARFPAPGRGSAPLLVSDHDAVLQIYVVPFSYQADGSGRQPPLTEARMTAMRDRLYKMYPVRDVELTLLPVQPTDVVIASSDGLGDLLEDVAAWRGENDIPASAYVYGLVQPADSFTEFCQGGCTIGLSYLVSNPNADGLRASVGVGFESVSADTFVHELGHAHGRRHAPCGNVSNADPGFPHAGGATGGAGWDVVEGVLIDSSEHSDFMGYCTPRWVSAYQFSAIFEQLLAVDGMSSFGPPEPQPTWTIAIREDRAPRLRRIEERVIQPGGEARDIEVVDRTGATIEQVQGHFYPFGHGGGGTLMVPDVGGHALRLTDGTLLSREASP